MNEIFETELAGFVPATPCSQGSLRVGNRPVTITDQNCPKYSISILQ